MLDPLTISKAFVVLGGTHTLLSHQAPIKAAQRFGYESDPLSIAMVEFLSCTGLASCIIAGCLFFGQMEARHAIAIGYIPRFLNSLKVVLNFDNHYSAIFGAGDAFKTLVFFTVHLGVLLLGIAYQTLWADPLLKLSLYWALLDGMRGLFATRSYVDQTLGGIHASKSKVLAMQRNNSGILLQFAVFSLLLLEGMPSTKAFGYGMSVNLLSLVSARCIYKDVQKEGFNNKGNTFWAFLYVVVIADLTLS